MIQGLNIDNQRRIHEFIKKELGSEGDPQKTESNLATIISILTGENWNQSTSELVTIPYEVGRKIEFNGLSAARSCIEDYSIHYPRLDKIYSVFDKHGANKSKSILDSIHREYSSNQNQFSDDELFFKVLDGVAERIQASANYVPIPYEELELCVNILVVDAFIRCKIFKNPEVNDRVTPR